MDTIFQVDQIDHVELFVPDRYQAAQWYQQTLGFQIVKAYEFWADDVNGPLMISTVSGGTKLALFTGKPQGQQTTAGYHLVAFRVTGKKFLEFVALLADLNLHNARREQITKEHVRDHDKSFSIYFCDPYGHRLEITSYDYEIIEAEL